VGAQGGGGFNECKIAALCLTPDSKLRASGEPALQQLRITPLGSYCMRRELETMPTFTAEA